MTHDYYDYLSKSVNIEEWINMGISIKTIAKHYKLDEDKLRAYLENKRAIRDQHQAIVDEKYKGKNILER